MLWLLTGVPRSGKTFRAVHEIDLLLRKTDTDGHPLDLLIVTNITGINIEDVRLVHREFEQRDFHNTTMVQYLSDLRAKAGFPDSSKIYLFIDECQRYFRKPDSETILFFDMHGHYGVDVCLISQHSKKIAFDISCHHEEEIRAVASRSNPFNSFVYRHMQADEQHAITRLPRDKRIFALYKSFDAGDGQVKKGNWRKIVVAAGVALPCLIALWFWLMGNSFAKQTLALNHNATKTIDTVKKVDSAPSLSNRPVSSGSASSESVQSEVNPPCLAPEILEYSSSRDAVKIHPEDSRFDLWIPVTQYVSDYPPYIYGYSYFHVRNKRLIQYSALSHASIFPVKNDLAHAQRIPMPVTTRTNSTDDVDSYTTDYTMDQKMYDHYQRVIATYKRNTDPNRTSYHQVTVARSPYAISKDIETQRISSLQQSIAPPAPQAPQVVVNNGKINK